MSEPTKKFGAQWLDGFTEVLLRVTSEEVKPFVEFVKGFADGTDDEEVEDTDDRELPPNSL
jgi:hypothetical protein